MSHTEELWKAVEAGQPVQWKWKSSSLFPWEDWTAGKVSFGLNFHHHVWRIKPTISLLELAETSNKVFESMRRIQQHLYFHPDSEMQEALGNLWVAINNYGNICRK